MFINYLYLIAYLTYCKNIILEKELLEWMNEKQSWADLESSMESCRGLQHHIRITSPNPTAHLHGK